MLRRFLSVILGSVCVSFIFVSASHVIAQTTEGGYKIFRPEGAGPHPAVVFLGGCSGYTPYFAPKHYEQ